MSCGGVTGQVSESKQFEWSIADYFSLSTGEGSFYKSPSFVFENTSLHLEIYPGGDIESESGFLSVFLTNESDSLLLANMYLYIKKADGTLTADKNDDTSIGPGESVGYYDFYRICYLEQNKSEFAPSGVVTIVCVLKPVQDGKKATANADNTEMLSVCGGVTGEVSESKQFEWSIADYFSLSTVKDYFYTSPSFVFENTSLHLEIYPGGEIESEVGFLSVFLKNESDSPFRATNSLHIKKADGRLTADENEDISIEAGENMGYVNFYRRCYQHQNRSKLVPSGILTIVCVLKPVKDRKQATVNADNTEVLSVKQIDETPDYRRLIEVYSSVVILLLIHTLFTEM